MEIILRRTKIIRMSPYFNACNINNNLNLGKLKTTVHILMYFYEVKLILLAIQLVFKMFCFQKYV